MCITDMLLRQCHRYLWYLHKYGVKCTLVPGYIGTSAMRKCYNIEARASHMIEAIGVLYRLATRKLWSSQITVIQLRIETSFFGVIRSTLISAASSIHYLVTCMHFDLSLHFHPKPITRPPLFILILIHSYSSVSFRSDQLLSKLKISPSRTRVKRVTQRKDSHHLETV